MQPDAVEQARELVNEKADDANIPIDEVEVTVGPTGEYHIRTMAYINGTKYGFETSITQNMLKNGKLSSTNILERQVELQIREMKEEITDLFEVNNHELVFNELNGFEATDRVTGESWHYTPKDVQTDFPISPPVDAEAPVPRSRVRHVGEGVFTEAEKERMRMYVIGWALQYSPQEWFQNQSRDI